MDIMFINGKFLSQRITGVQRYAREMIQALDRIYLKLDLQVVLLVPRKYDKTFKLKHIGVRPCGVLKGILWEQLELPYYARDGFLLNLCNSAPIVKTCQSLTVHDAATAAVPDSYSFPFRIWYGLIHRLLGRKLRCIFTDSDFSKYELHKYYQIPMKKVHVVHLGADHIRHMRAVEAPDVTCGLIAKKFVLAVSSMNRQKNFRLILQAAAKRQDFTFVIVGGRQEEIFKSNDFENHTNNVVFVGYVTDEQLVYLYRQAMCFVFPSIYEGFGLPPLEAMSCGCPVIASKIEPLMEVCGDAAVYCDPYDPDGLVLAIDKIFADEGYRKMLEEKGLEHSGQFTWDRAIAQLMGVLHREFLLGRGNIKC